MTAIKAFLIEPLAGTIRPVTIDRENSYLDIKTYLKCDMIDIVRLEDGHEIIVDDDGLDETLPCITEVRGGQTPLAGTWGLRSRTNGANWSTWPKPSRRPPASSPSFARFSIRSSWFRSGAA